MVTEAVERNQILQQKENKNDRGDGIGTDSGKVVRKMTKIWGKVCKGVAYSGALYLLAVMPRIMNRPDVRLFRKKYFAHRGLYNEAMKVPENSMAAFRRAVEAGYGIELDVQMTKDNIPVIFHDNTMERMCGVKSKVEDYTYEELAQFKLADSEEGIPRLEDMLALVSGRVPLIVEIKSETKNVSFCAVIDRMLRAYQGEYCIESFNPMVLLWFRRYHNSTIRGQLSSNFRFDGGYKSPIHFCMTHLLLNFFTAPDFIAYNHQFEEEPGRRICHWLYRHPAAAWTIRSKEELEKMSGKFDVFIFENFLP